MITTTAQCRYGLMTYLPHDLYVGKALDLYGEYSYGETGWWEQLLQPGMTVVDVGANLGAHTVALGHIVGPTGYVYAFEPQVELCTLLQQNITQNNISGSVINCALGAFNSSSMSLPPIDYSRPNNFGAVELGQYEHRATIPLQRLDAYFDTNVPQPHHVEFIKLDVEGFEPQVLKGATQLISTHLPMLEIECDREGTLPKLQSILEPLGYDLYWHVTYLYNPDNYLSNPTNIYSTQASVNVFANVEGVYANLRSGPLPRCADLIVTVVRSEGGV